MDGIIVSKSFARYLVYADNENYVVSIAKTLKQTYNPWPGDFVEIDIDQLTILSVQPPKNVLKRPRISNLDQLFIVSSLVKPDFSWPLIYRYLAYAIYYEVKPFLIISKVDLVKTIIEEFHREISYLTIPVIYFSPQGEGIEQIRSLLKDHISAFAGQTGVGKSTILNQISPEFQQKIGSYSKALGRGRHETKQVQLFPYNDGFIADTPGFSSLELDFGQDELAFSFPGFAPYAHLCKFANCLHQQESGCQIKIALKDGKISDNAYQVYLQILKSLPFRKEHY